MSDEYEMKDEHKEAHEEGGEEEVRTILKATARSRIRDDLVLNVLAGGDRGNEEARSRDGI